MAEPVPPFPDPRSSDPTGDTDDDDAAWEAVSLPKSRKAKTDAGDDIATGDAKHNTAAHHGMRAEHKRKLSFGECLCMSNHIVFLSLALDLFL